MSAIQDVLLRIYGLRGATLPILIVVSLSTGDGGCSSTSLVGYCAVLHPVCNPYASLQLYLCTYMDCKRGHISVSGNLKHSQCLKCKLT